MRYPVAKGKINTNRQGRILLTNPDGKSIGVHETMAYIWEQATGMRTIKQIQDLMIEELGITNENDQQIERDNITLAIRTLEKKGFIEFMERP